MRPRRTMPPETAAIARRRLDLLSAELAALRSRPGDAAEAVEEDAHEVADDQGPTGQQPAGPGRHARRPVPGGRRFGQWLHDRLPPTLQGRVALGAGHLTVVALVAAVALGVTAWWVLQADGSTTLAPSSMTPTREPSAVEAPLVAPAADEATTPGPSATPMVVVDVAGKVRRPGIVTLPRGSRVVDAIERAGGVRRGVDLTSLNLARILADGEQVLVGLSPPGGVAPPAASGATDAGAAPGGLVNVNSATSAQLEELPGVGPVTAGAIIEWRTQHGPFTAVDELLEVSGIGEATLAEIAPHVTL